jgi:DNA-binding CsgD family transcriptional regulator
MYQGKIDCAELSGPESGSLAQIINSIGDESFHDGLLSFLHRNIGAEHCATLAFTSDRPVKVGAVSLDGTDTAGTQVDLYLKSYWRADPTMVAAHSMVGQTPSRLDRLNIAALPPSDLRDLIYGRTHISERLLLSGSVAGAGISLSILRSEQRGTFTDDEVSRLEEMAHTLLAIIAKHAALARGQRDLSVALSSLEVILDCMAHAPEGLPRREVEVCARSIYGISSFGIGLELDIGEETVKTYRKRAYQRLGIATHHELLLWYVKRWSERLSRAH